MNRLIVPALIINAALLAARVYQEIPANAQGAGVGAGERPLATVNGDVNADDVRDIADATYLLAWLFLGGPAPVAIAQSPGLTPEQAEILAHMEMVDLPVDDAGATARTIRFRDVNVQIVNGLGATNGNQEDPLSIELTETNGLGNLIVGYQETIGKGDARTGSHNIVVGQRHTYTSFGGLVAGFANTISGAYATVCGGDDNVASGSYSSVSGGILNTSTAEWSTVSGGRRNSAEADDAHLP